MKEKAEVNRRIIQDVESHEDPQKKMAKKKWSRKELMNE
jgi:hypothetical protein